MIIWTICILACFAFIVGAFTLLTREIRNNEQSFQQQLRQNPQQALDQLMVKYNLGNEIIAYKAGKPIKARRINGKVVIIDEIPKRGRNKPSS